MKFFFLLAALLVTSACGSTHEYHVYGSYLVEGSDLVYVTTGREEQELEACASKTCVLFESRTVVKDSKALVIDPRTGSQSEADRSPTVFTASGKNTFSQTVHLLESDVVSDNAHLGLISPQGYVAFLDYNTPPRPTVVIGPNGVVLVDTGAIPFGTKAAASDTSVTYATDEPFRVARFDWANPTPTQLQPVEVAQLNEPLLKFISLSPRGSHALFEIYDVELRDDAGQFLGHGSSATKYAVAALPDGQRVATLDLTGQSPSNLTWLDDNHLIVNVQHHEQTVGMVYPLTGTPFQADTPIETRDRYTSNHHLPMSDVLFTRQGVLTPEGRFTELDGARGVVVEGRQGWSMNANAELYVHDFDRKTSTKLSDVGGDAVLRGKNGAGLIVVDPKKKRLWTFHPTSGEKREFAIHTQPSASN